MQREAPLVFLFFIFYIEIAEDEVCFMCSSSYPVMFKLEFGLLQATLLYVFGRKREKKNDFAVLLGYSSSYFYFATNEIKMSVN